MPTDGPIQVAEEAVEAAAQSLFGPERGEHLNATRIGLQAALDNGLRKQLREEWREELLSDEALIAASYAWKQDQTVKAAFVAALSTIGENGG